MTDVLVESEQMLRLRLHAQRQRYDSLFGEANSAIGTAPFVRFPSGNEYNAITGEPVGLKRYDTTNDEMVSVDQEWIDLAQRTMTRLHFELQEAKRQITQLTILAPAVEAETDTNTIDHMWRMVEAFGR